MTTSDATATFEILNSTTALVEVSYPAGGFGMQRVEVKHGLSLYEAAYNAASIKCSIQGVRLGRFSHV